MNLHHCVSGWQLLTHPIEIAVSERMPAGWGCNLLTQVGIVSGCVEDVWLCRWPWLRFWLPRVAAFLLNPGSSKLPCPLGHHPEQQRPAEKNVSGIFCYTEEMGSFRVTNSWEGGRQSGEPRREMGPRSGKLSTTGRAATGLPSAQPLQTPSSQGGELGSQHLWAVTFGNSPERLSKGSGLGSPCPELAHSGAHSCCPVWGVSVEGSRTGLVSGDPVPFPGAPCSPTSHQPKGVGFVVALSYLSIFEFFHFVFWTLSQFTGEWTSRREG